MSEELDSTLNEIAKALRALGNGDLLDDVDQSGAIEGLALAIQEAGSDIRAGLQAVADALVSRR